MKCSGHSQREKHVRRASSIEFQRSLGFAAELTDRNAKSVTVFEDMAVTASVVLAFRTYLTLDLVVTLNYSWLDT